MRIMHLSRATLMIRQFLLPLIRQQKEAGHEVYVCSSDDEHVNALVDEGIEVFPHHLQRSLNPLILAREIRRIRRILTAQQVDVLVCHSPLGAGVGRIAAHWADVPRIVYMAHGLPCAPGQNFVLWHFWFAIEKYLARITDRVLVMNDYDEDLCRTRLYGDSTKVCRIPGMGVDIQRFDPSQNLTARQEVCAELGIPSEATLVLGIAYLIPEKGIFVYQDAAMDLCKKASNLYFLLAGNGPREQQLIRRSRRYGLSEHFRVLGWRNDVHRLMRAADMYVLPTYYFEGLPVSILEAMACGKPVITTKHRGCEDVVVDGETGYLVPVRDSRALSQQIMHLTENASLRRAMGDAGRRRIEEHFELEACTRLIEQAIESVASEA